MGLIYCFCRGFTKSQSYLELALELLHQRGWYLMSFLVLTTKAKTGCNLWYTYIWTSFSTNIKKKNL